MKMHEVVLDHITNHGILHQGPW